MKNKAIFYLFAIIFVVTIITPLTGYTQGEQANLEKYWRYRQRFRDHFIVESSNIENQGVNWPAFEYRYGWEPQYECDVIDFSDGNPNMFSYLTVLSTELWLLKTNNQDYSQTLQDLYYFMLAVERLDCYSEKNWRIKLGLPNTDVDTTTDFNGFHTRDDASTSFFNANSTTFQNVSAKYISVGAVASNYTSSGDIHMEGSSHDNLSRNVAGLAILNKLVGLENVSSIPVTWTDGYIEDYLTNRNIKDGDYIDFGKWAKDLVVRYIHQLQAPREKFLGGHWVLVNPVKVEAGYCSGLFYSLCKDDLVCEGNGFDGGIELGSSFGFIYAAEEITGIDANDLLEPGVPLPSGTTHHMSINNLAFFDPIAGYLEAIAATEDNLPNEDTYSALINIRDNFMKTDDNANGEEYHAPYEVLPLLYLVMHDQDKYNTNNMPEDYDDEYDYYLNLLDKAPHCFPGSNYAWEYSSTSRLIWPPDLSPETDRESNGLDYMALHNLFYVIFIANDYKFEYISQDVAFDIEAAGSGIIADNTIYSGNVVYEATNPNLSITLKPGFQALTGCDFLATISTSDCIGSAYREMDLNDQCEQSTWTPPIIPFPSKTTINNDSTTYEEELSLESRALSFGEPTCNIYPNPVNNIARLVIENVNIEEFGLNRITVEVYDVTGKSVLHMQTMELQVDIDMSAFTQGMYSVRVYSDAFQFNKQIIKK